MSEQKELFEYSNDFCGDVKELVDVVELDTTDGRVRKWGIPGVMYAPLEYPEAYHSKKYVAEDGSFVVITFRNKYLKSLKRQATVIQETAYECVYKMAIYKPGDKFEVNGINNEKFKCMLCHTPDWKLIFINLDDPSIVGRPWGYSFIETNAFDSVTSGDMDKFFGKGKWRRVDD